MRETAEEADQCFLADNSIGAIGLGLIHLPAQVVDNIQAQIGHSLAAIGGKKGFVSRPHDRIAPGISIASCGKHRFR